MCGIAGVLGDLRGVSTTAMLDAIAHRGPDADGAHTVPLAGGAALWLGHRRLAIQDLSDAGRQPMLGHDGRRVIVFNGEIYNFKELREALTAEGERFTTGTDTEVILAGFRCWGEAALDRFRGMFAFALYDPDEGTLTLARDRLGEKPLYYAAGRDRFAFASEVRALTASGVVEREIDPDGLDAYLTFGSLADPYTLVRGVRAVAAGEVVVLREGVLRRRRYWSLRGLDAAGPPSREAAVEAVRARLRAAVQRVMVADVPVAVLLSGGIDSSSNVVLLSEQKWTNINTFSVVFGDADAAYSEAPYSRLVAERFHTKHQQVEVSVGDARSLVARAVDAMDQPSLDGVNTYLVCDAIRRAGIKVAVSGQGADELFLGYQQRRMFGALLAASTATPALAKRALGALRGRWPVPADHAGEKVLAAIGAGDPVAGAYLAQHSVFAHPALERLRGGRRPEPTRFVDAVGGRSPLDRLSRLELTHYLKNTLLRDGDQMSMAHSLELRAPFLDADLVEQVVAIDPAWKLDPARNKPLLLDAVGPALPREVWDRPKRGFGLPYDRWLREGLDLGAPDGPEVGLDPAAVRGVRERFLAGTSYARYWSLVVLSRWARRERMGTSWLHG